MSKARKPRNPLAAKFGRFARQLRKARGLTQEQLAERSELAADTIRRMELGQFSPTLDTLVKLVAGLRLDLSALFVGFELGEVGTPRELAALAASLSPAERVAALRVLEVLAKLARPTGAPSEGEGDPDA